MKKRIKIIIISVISVIAIILMLERVILVSAAMNGLKYLLDLRTSSPLCSRDFDTKTVSALIASANIDFSESPVTLKGSVMGT